MDEDWSGLVFKGNIIETQLRSLKNSILSSRDENTEAITMAFGRGEYDSTRFPTKPNPLPSPVRTTLSQLDKLLGNPGINIVGLVRCITKKGVHISELMRNTPTIRIWFNVGECPLIVKIKSEKAIYK